MSGDEIVIIKTDDSGNPVVDPIPSEAKDVSREEVLGVALDDGRFIGDSDAP